MILNPRRFVLPGTYTAQSSDCRQSQTFEYTLYKEDCTCEVYIPNAFSPNFDGRNDQLSLFTDCSIESINYTVYDRWGELIFQSDIPYQWWDGTFRGVPCLTGVYVLQVKARLSDSIGFGFEYEQTQSITLLR